MSLFQFGFKKTKSGSGPPSQKLSSPSKKSQRKEVSESRGFSTGSSSAKQRASKSPARRSPRGKSKEKATDDKRKAEEEAIVVDDSSDAVEVIDPPVSQAKRRKVDATVEDVKKVNSDAEDICLYSIIGLCRNGRLRHLYLRKRRSQKLCRWTVKWLL